MDQPLKFINLQIITGQEHKELIVCIAKQLCFIGEEIVSREIEVTGLRSLS